MWNLYSNRPALKRLKISLTNERYESVYPGLFARGDYTDLRLDNQIDMHSNAISEEIKINKTGPWVSHQLFQMH